jgi:hypothetical protein
MALSELSERCYRTIGHYLSTIGVHYRTIGPGLRYITVCLHVHMYIYSAYIITRTSCQYRTAYWQLHPAELRVLSREVWRYLCSF